MTTTQRDGARSIIADRALRAVRWVSLQEAPFSLDAFCAGVQISARAARRYLASLERHGLVVAEPTLGSATKWRTRARLVRE